MKHDQGEVGKRHRAAPSVETETHATLSDAPNHCPNCKDAPRDANCVFQELERIDTVKLAARGLSDEANAIGQARIMLDRIIGAK